MKQNNVREGDKERDGRDKRDLREWEVSQLIPKYSTYSTVQYTNSTPGTISGLSEFALLLCSTYAVERKSKSRTYLKVRK